MNTETANISPFKKKMKRAWDTSLVQMSKLGNQRHMAALRDGYALLVPLMIAASVGVVCMTFVFGWWKTTSTSILGWISWGIPGQVGQDANGIVDFVDGSVAKKISEIGTFIFYTVWKAIINNLSIFVTLTIAYSLSVSKQIKLPFISSLVGLGAFLVLAYGDSSLFGTNGMILAILASLLSIELYSVFEKNKKLEIKMPAGVPPAVGRSFSKLFPAIFTLLIMVAFQAPFIITRALSTSLSVDDSFGIGQIISTSVQAPFIELTQSKSGSLAIGLVFVTFAGLLWFFGIHGPNVLTGIFAPVWVSALINNQEWLANGKVGEVSAFADGVQDAFVFFGGTGVTGAFVLMGLFFSRKKEIREILKFGGAPSVFNINEPILFGIPLILNFKYFIPFCISQPVLYIITWLAIEQLHWVPPVIVKIPWTTPVGIGGFLATSSWQGLVLALFNFAVACLIWAPFIFLSNRSAKKAGEDLVKIDYKGGWKKFARKLTKQKQVIEASDSEEGGDNGTS